MKKSAFLFIASAILFVSFFPVRAQDQQQQQPTQQPTAEDVAKQKADWSKNAYRLLDQVVDEAQSLRLPENRVRVQINAADMLWEHNQSRARTLFSQAADGVVEMMRSVDSNNGR